MPPATSNLLHMYLYHLGDSEVPREFHFWACLGLIASAVADRVYFRKFRHHDKRLFPNLYIHLVGPSGCGKGEAIDAAMHFGFALPRVNVYNGKATAPYLLSYMARPNRDPETKAVRLSNAKVWFVTEELSMSVGKGEQADALIKTMTKLYTGSPYPLDEGTRLHGNNRLEHYCVNWLAGTTMDWLVDCVPPDAIKGGFFGRVAGVVGAYDMAKRIRRPTVPHDADVYEREIASRLRVLSHVAGEMTMDPDADALEAQWYDNRPAPTDETLFPTWKRAHDLLLKLSMVLSLADDIDLVIKKPHVMWAQKLIAETQRAMPGIVKHAHVTTPEQRHASFVEDTLHRAKAMQHSTLLRQLANRGGNAETLRGVLETLMQAKRITRLPHPTGGWMYQWRGSNGHLREAGES